MLAVIAIGGNSLIRDKHKISTAAEYTAAGETCQHIADLIAQGWDVVIGHGNGPQIGFNLRRSELAKHELFELPLDVCGTFTQGSIGYYLQQNLQNIFRRRHIKRRVITLITQVEVDPADPAFARPTKPVGMFLDEQEAAALTAKGWQVMEDAGRGWRRVVHSPRPWRILEEETIKLNIGDGTVVITVGGGGIPVAPKGDGSGDHVGMRAVIDKDFACSLLAQRLTADLLLISTAVPQVAVDFGLPTQRWLDTLTVDDAADLIAAGQFAPGSMLPKVQAAVEFVQATGQRAIITNPENMIAAVDGRAGTTIIR